MCLNYRLADKNFSYLTKKKCLPFLAENKQKIKMKLPLNDFPIQREVREWQKTDLNTGARLSGRFEAHRFNVGALKKYGQVRLFFINLME